MYFLKFAILILSILSFCTGSDIISCCNDQKVKRDNPFPRCDNSPYPFQDCIMNFNPGCPVGCKETSRPHGSTICKNNQNINITTVVDDAFEDSGIYPVCLDDGCSWQLNACKPTPPNMGYPCDNRVKYDSFGSGNPVNNRSWSFSTCPDNYHFSVMINSVEDCGLYHQKPGYCKVNNKIFLKHLTFEKNLPTCIYDKPFDCYPRSFPFPITITSCNGCEMDTLINECIPSSSNVICGVFNIVPIINGTCPEGHKIMNIQDNFGYKKWCGPEWYYRLN